MLEKVGKNRSWKEERVLREQLGRKRRCKEEKPSRKEGVRGESMWDEKL